MAWRWINPRLFVESTPPPGANGGLANAIMGSFILYVVFMRALVSVPQAGILAGTYLAEFGRTSRLGAVVRFVNDILLSAPSIIIGVFVYALIVLRAGHFSGWAGAVALALIVLPVVVRTTENMMRLVPDEAWYAGGGGRAWGTRLEGHDPRRVPQRPARDHDRHLAGHGAHQWRDEHPCSSQRSTIKFWSTDMTRPFPNLPAVIFQFAMSPYDDWQHLAWAGALLITGRTHPWHQHRRQGDAPAGLHTVRGQWSYPSHHPT